MSINLTLFPTEAEAIVYMEDGTSLTFSPQAEQQFQLPSGSFCTISSTAGHSEEDEHQQPQGPTPEEFAKRMITFWTGLLDRAAAQQPTATPV